MLKNSILTYDFYVANGGKLDEFEFNRLLRHAVSYVNHFTFGRLADYEDEDNIIKFLLMDMIELEHRQTNQITYQRTGDASVGFNVSSERKLETMLQELTKPVLSNIFIDGVRSNYRGV